MLRFAAPTIVALTLLGCPEPDAGCPECAPADLPLAAGDCPPGAMAKLGERDCSAVGVSRCAAGFVRDETGWGCLEVTAPEACPPGTSVRLGSDACQPVGMAPCPDGFAAAADGFACREVVAAEPCAGATSERLGAAACVDVGDCSAIFPPSDATRFVDDDFADAELDAVHHRAIRDALAAAAAGDVIAVYPGVYSEVLTPPAGVTLVGACASEVRVQGTGEASAGVLVRAVEGVTLRALALSGHDIAVEVDQGGGVVLEDVVLDGNQRIGVLVRQIGSSASLTRVVVRDTESRADGSGGRGLSVQEAASAELLDVTFVGNREIGLSASGAGTRVTGARVVVRGTRRSAAGVGGWGIGVRSGSRLELVDVVVAESQRIGLAVRGDGSFARLERATLRDTSTGVGAHVIEGGELELVDGSLVENLASAMHVADPGSAASLSRVAVVGTRTTPLDVTAAAVVTKDGAALRLEDSAVLDNAGWGVSALGAGTRLEVVGGYLRGGDDPIAPGLVVGSGAALTVATSLVDGARAAGVYADGEATTLLLEDSLVRGTQPVPSGQVGGGILVEGGARAELSRVAAMENHSFGLIVLGEGTTATATDSVFRDTLADPALSPAQGGGAGIYVGEGATLELAGVDVATSVDAALQGEPGSRVAATRSAFRATRPRANGQFGVGVFSGGDVELDGVAILDHHISGLGIVGPGATAVVTDSLIGTTASYAVDGAYGHGVVVLDATLELSSSHVRASEGIGLVFDASRGVVSRTVVADNRVGVHAQGGSKLVEADRVEAGELEVVVSRDSRFFGNETRVGSGAIPMPEPLPPADPVQPDPGAP